MFENQNVQSTVAGLREEHVVQFLFEHFKNANLHNQASSQANAPDANFNSNEKFWAALLSEQKPNLKWVELKGFQIVDWFPRTPGLYYTSQAKAARREAERFIREKNGIQFYNPHGKFHMMEGGLGAVRFKPISLESEEYCLYTATSSGDCHSGIPLAIPASLLREIDFSDYKYKFVITGKVKFLPKVLEEHFQHSSRIPQIYVVVDRCKVISKKRSATAVKITPMVFFKAEAPGLSEMEDNWRWYSNQGHVAYANCHADSLQELDQASDWLEQYVTQYSGRIITNFDEQRPAFARVPFSLQNIMNGDLAQNLIQEFSNGNSGSIYKVIQIHLNNSNNVQIGDNCTMSDDRTINTGGGNYIESNTGTYVQGNYINMSQDLTQAAQQIQQLLQQLQNTGMTEEQAQQQVANDIATQAHSNPTVMGKLVKWGQSLGDAAAKTTVSDIVKGAVKLALNSAGIPLP